jgi:hypothetical protein
MPASRQPSARRSTSDCRRYRAEGGSPEAQGANPGDRAMLLLGYVDVVVLRDVIERHAVSSPLALRWTPGTASSARCVGLRAHIPRPKRGHAEGG